MNKTEIKLDYDPSAEKEWLPSPKFEGVYWQGMSNEVGVQGQQVIINDESWILDHVGFQGSEGKARVQLHEEPTQQEDVFFLSGGGEMTIWNGLDCSRGRNELVGLKGIFSKEELVAAKFVLAVVSWSMPYLHDEVVDHLVLNVEAGDHQEIVRPVSTRQGFHHGYVLSEPSHYLIVKRSRLGS